MLIFVLTAVIFVQSLAGLVLFMRQRRTRLSDHGPDFNAITRASTNDCIVVQSLDGKIIWANPAYLRIFRLPADQVIGQKPLSLCLSPDSM
jgi:PAS domain-containing protein